MWKIIKAIIKVVSIATINAVMGALQHYNCIPYESCTKIQVVASVVIGLWPL